MISFPYIKTSWLLASPCWGCVTTVLTRSTNQTVDSAVCGFGCWGWSKRKLLGKVGWLSVRQLVFYHTVLQAHKTLKSGVPKALYQSFSSTYPYKTRSAASGQIRQNQVFTSQSSFKYRAMQCYNQVPSSIRLGSTATVKRKLKLWIKSNIPID